MLERRVKHLEERLGAAEPAGADLEFWADFYARTRWQQTEGGALTAKLYGSDGKARDTWDVAAAGLVGSLAYWRRAQARWEPEPPSSGREHILEQAAGKIIQLERGIVEAEAQLEALGGRYDYPGPQGEDYEEVRLMFKRLGGRLTLSDIGADWWGRFGGDGPRAEPWEPEPQPAPLAAPALVDPPEMEPAPVVKAELDVEPEEDAPESAPPEPPPAIPKIPTWRRALWGDSSSQSREQRRRW